jgi:hypothetical protein
MYAVFNEEQELNASCPIVVTVDGIFIDVSPVPQNEPCPRVVTELGIDTDFRLGQYLKALPDTPTTLYVFPLYVTDDGIVTVPVYSSEKSLTPLPL